MNDLTKNAGSPLHVVLGAGQVGMRLASILSGRGLRVRVVQRSVPIDLPAGIEHVRADMTDLAAAERATEGAAVVYDCMNPAYHTWGALLLPMARGAIHGAEKAGAKLVALDCLYMYGRPDGAMTEDSPLAPCSEKGKLRVALHELRMSAHREGKARVAIARASDFFGADLPYSSFSDRFYSRALAGKSAECLGDPDMPHSYTYVDDVAAALAVLGTTEKEAEAFGKVWMVPTIPAETTRALVDRLGRALALTITTKRIPKVLLRVAGLFDPFMREVVEMTYQWEVPYVLDSSAFERTFGLAPTPIERQVAQTAAWAEEHYGVKRRAAFVAA